MPRLNWTDDQKMLLQDFDRTFGAWNAPLELHAEQRQGLYDAYGVARRCLFDGGNTVTVRAYIEQRKARAEATVQGCDQVLDWLHRWEADHA